MINSLPFFLWVKSGNISRKFLTFILKIFDKNFERLHSTPRFSYFILIVAKICQITRLTSGKHREYMVNLTAHEYIKILCQIKFCEFHFIIIIM